MEGLNLYHAKAVSNRLTGLLSAQDRIEVETRTETLIVQYNTVCTLFIGEGRGIDRWIDR